MVAADMVIPTTRLDVSIRVAGLLIPHVVHEGVSNTAGCIYTSWMVHPTRRISAPRPTHGSTVVRLVYVMSVAMSALLPYTYLRNQWVGSLPLPSLGQYEYPVLHVYFSDYTRLPRSRQCQVRSSWKVGGLRTCILGSVYTVLAHCA